MASNLLSYAGWTFLPNVSDSLPLPRGTACNPPLTLLPPPFSHKTPHNNYYGFTNPSPSLLPQQLATSWLQTIYYGLSIRAGDPKPQPGSPRYNLHRRRIFIGVILAYLLYTVFEADYDLRRKGDFYRSLGVPLDVEERGVKSRFRRL